MTEKLVYKVIEVAEALSISRTKAYELIASGAIPSVKLGGSVRVPVAALQKWIEENTTPKAQQTPEDTKNG